MKLDELVGIKRFKKMSPVEAARFINQEFAKGTTKLKVLGSGNHAVALTNGTDVYKFWYADSGYVRFASIAMQHQDNPWFPKFKSRIKIFPKFIKIGDSEEGIFYVKMEKLQGLEDEVPMIPVWKGEVPDVGYLAHPPAKVGAEAMIHSIHIQAQFAGLVHGDLEEYLIMELRRMFQSRQGSITEAQAAKFIKELDPLYIQLMDAIRVMIGVKGTGAWFDLGIDNFAMRGNQPVILDPIADSDDANLSFNVLKLDQLHDD